MYCNYQLLGERRDISDKAATAAVCTAITQSIIAREIHKVHPQLSAQHSTVTDSLRRLITVLYQLVTCSVTLNTVCSATTSPSATALVINSGFNYTFGAIRYPRRSDTD